jgi:APA family basic amino acid/polyamine antiporter
LISYPDLVTKLATEQAEPLTMALEHANPDLGWAVGIVAFGSVIAHTAVLLVFQLGQPRIFFSMARDGLLPPVFYKVHPRFRTPHISTILTGLFVAVFAAFASIDEMVDLTNIGTLFAFILVAAGIIVLRRRDPARPRPFKVPFGLVIPVLGIVSCLYLIYYLPPTSWLRFAAWLNFGFVIYVGYGSVKSRLTGRQNVERKSEHDAQTAYLGMWLGLIGTALLVLTRGFDLLLEGVKKGSDLASAFAGVIQLQPWLEVSWFLIVPLFLNAFVLWPIVLRRAARSKREGVSGAGATQAIAVVAGLLTIVYLALVVAQ